MDIAKELQEARTNQAQIIARINTLEREFTKENQQLLQEALKLEGEIRLLKRMNGEKEVSPENDKG